MALVKNSVQDYCIGLCLCLVYGIAPSLVYTTGFLQAAWLEEELLTPSFGSFINSLTFTLTCIPAPLIQRLLAKLELKPYTISMIALPLLVSGIVWSSFCHDKYSLLISNGVLVGLGCCMELIATWNALYFMYTDSQVYLFNGFMLAGAGVGLIPTSLLFLFAEPVYGWRTTQQLTAIMCSSLVLFAIVLTPPVRKILGIKTREEKNTELAAIGDEDTNDEQTLTQADCNIAHEDTCIFSDVNENDVIGSEVENRRNDVINEGSSEHVEISLANEESEFTGNAFKYVCTNFTFWLALVSFVFTAQAYDTIMVHQPVRMNSMGFGSGAGSFALAINGAIQAVFRVLCGVVTSRGYISPIRLSQLAKIMLLVTTITSLFVINELYQTAYYFTLGFSGAVINTADFFLVKECMKSYRDFAVTLELSIAGIMTLGTMTLVGYMYQLFKDYDIAFYYLIGLFSLGLIPAFLYEIQLKRKRATVNRGFGYTALS